MFRILAILMLFTNFCAFAQVLPKEGNMLSYRIIGFSVPKEKKAGHYKFDIADGNWVSEDSFAKKIIVSELSGSNSAILEVPSFGKQYTWQVSYINKNKVKEKSPLFHFTVLYSRRTDTAYNRLRILHPAESCKDCYVMSESNQTVYDMMGNPVWCVPDADVIAGETLDMKFTSGSTITSLNLSTAFELDYNGNIVWVSSKF